MPRKDYSVTAIQSIRKPVRKSQGTSRLQCRKRADNHTVFPPIGEITVGDKNHQKRRFLHPRQVNLVRDRQKRRRPFVNQSVSAKLYLHKTVASIAQMDHNVTF